MVRTISVPSCAISIQSVVVAGSGISEDNYVGLALKYHTSKLRSFDDLLAVETYGFRFDTAP
jgi:DNA mismatch repair ATPase MutL